jgi:hypothetical protein
MDFMPPQIVSMKGHLTLTEKWLQQRIAEDTTLLGLGDLVVKDVERRQPHAGRLDLLLTDLDGGTRYEVEIQLGPTDESHIIRTIEYWDIERRRYPQYEHVAVIAAEDITSRFLNVISLFNGFIPLIALQIRALQVQGILTLVATKVMDVATLATDEEDDSGGATDRSFWETTRASKETLGLTDRMLEIVRAKIDPNLTLKYNKFYIGLAKDGLPNNFVQFRPRRQHLIAEFKIPRSDELTARIEEAGVDAMDYQTRWGQYRVRLTSEEITKNEPFLTELIEEAYKASGK